MLTIELFLVQILGLSKTELLKKGLCFTYKPPYFSLAQDHFLTYSAKNVKL